MTSVASMTMPGTGEMLIILAIFVLLFGAKKLPELGSSVGGFLKGIRAGTDDDDE